MQAWRVEKHGGTGAADSALVLRDLPMPVPGPMEVLVKVEAVGLNHLDIWVRKGVPGHKFPLPLTPGCDVAGTIAAFGPGAEGALSAAGPGGTALCEGAPVLLHAGVSCGRCQACLSGFDPLCPRYGILGETRDGGCADFIVVPATNVIARPAGMSAVEAATLPIPYLTAWEMLFVKARLKPAETCLIQAGGSGVSVAAIQMAKLVGATVITTVGSAEKAAKARALGADHVIQRTSHHHSNKEKPFRDELKAILKSLGKKGCEVVIDHVGQDTFADSIRSLAWGGRLVTCGATSGADVKVDLKAVFFKNLSILGSTMGSKADFLRVLELVSQGKLKAIVDSAFPMSELPRAHEYLESRRAFGNVVVTH
jgi:NADPH:quinone reductase-like Zn-dependent oxidoreductase